MMLHDNDEMIHIERKGYSYNVSHTWIFPWQQGYIYIKVAYVTALHGQHSQLLYMIKDFESPQPHFFSLCSILVCELQRWPTVLLPLTFSGNTLFRLTTDYL